jgi:transposase
MRQPIMVGCDLHDKTMLLKIARGSEAPRMMSIRNTASGRSKMISQLLALADGQDVVFAYEASGQGFGLYDELTRAKITCHVLAPTKIARSTRGKGQKTDEKDAEDLFELLRAHLLAGNRLPKVWIPDIQTRDDRALVRARLDLTDKRTGVKRQIKGLLKRHGLARSETLRRGWTRGYAAWLRVVAGDERLSFPLRCALTSLLRQVEFLDQEMERLDHALEELARAPRYAREVAQLTKLKGVGVLTALVFLTEMGELSRFANRRQLSAYLGLAPSSYESGAQSDRKGHITRQGSSRVRRVLCQAAWTRVRHDGPAQAAYERLLEKNPKRKKIAVVAAMRRLAVLMWHRSREAPSSASAGWPGPPEACSAPVG